MRRPRTTETEQREKRQNVFFTVEANAFAPALGSSRISHSPTGSNSSQRASMARHVSMLEASRHRLSIRKSAAFPMQQTAPKPFLSSCADITRHGRDWNAEFQLAWEMEDNTIAQAEARMEQLRRVEREFVAEATRTVKQIVMLDDDGPRELPKFLQCYRVDNIFFRVLPDSRSGRNYVASLRGVLQSRTRLLTVPLSCMFFYRGMPVLAQALVPMPREPTRLYGADSTNNQEVEAEILHMAEALNIPFPDGTLEVYEGLDGRFYLTNSNSTLTPLFVDDTIMKRQEMLRVCPCVTDGHEDTIAVLDTDEVLDTIVASCMDSGASTMTDCLRIVCEHLHGFGVNMCLLKQVIQKVATSDVYDAAAVAKVKECLFVEMLARSVKQEFYLEVQGKRVAYDDEVLSATLSKQMAEAFTSVDVFQSRFLEVVAKKYGVVDEDNDIIRGLTAVRLSRKGDIVARICSLLGVTIEKTGAKKSNMIWHVTVNARVLPRLIDPRQVRVLAEKYRTIVTQDTHRYAFCLPMRWKVACWDGEYDEALDLVHATAVAQRDRCGEAAIVPLYSRRSVCEVCFATMQKNCIAEGRSLFPGVMRGFEELTCFMTQGRRHIEYGFWLLRVALVYQQDDLVTYRGCVEEAVHHFYQAIEKLPAYLRSEHGSWLHLQPYKGLLQCKRLLPSCSVNTKELVERSIELSTIGWASDFFMLYLWDLSLQLEAEGRHEDAIRVLLTAITVSKKKPTVSLDLPSLLMDAAYIYRSWDPEKYSEHCVTLMREAAEKASELFGPQSKEYAVVLNNKGAVEIELNRLSNAGETLKRAGIAFAEAGVPKDDPDYLAYLDNLVYLEQRLAARPVVQRGFLRRYPFLAGRSEEFPFRDVRPLEDDVFVGLAHQRARMASGTSDAKNLEKRMKERIWELLRFIQDGDVLKRYPFLPAVINGVPTASLRLDDDIIFEEFARLLREKKDADGRRELEACLREYVVKKAEDAALQRAYMDRQDEEFNEAHEGYVNLMHPIPWLYVLEDERFNVLTDQLQKCVNTQGHTARIQAIQEKMAQRVAEIEGETFRWRGELAEWLPPSKLYSVHAKDLTEDMQLRDLLRVRQFPESCEGVSVDTINVLIREKLEALWKRASIIRSCLAVDDEELHREFPFLVEMPHHQRLSTLMLYEDPTVSNLATRLRTEGNDSLLQTEMMGAIKAIAARQRDAKELKKWYYDIDSVVSGVISLESVPKVRDDYYVQLWQKRNIIQAQQGEKSPLMVTLMHQMEHRIVQMNSWMRKVSANGFRRRLRLEAKYPFVKRRHEGYTLDMLDIEDDEEFMSLVERRRRLLASQDAPPDELKSLGRQADKRVERIAMQRVSLSEELSEKYPFIPSRLEGVETLTICLEENESFAEKAAYYNRLRHSGSGENEVRCRRLVREMESLALAVAREIGVRNWRESIEAEDLHERYPFLPEEPVRGISLGDVRPVQQPAFRELSNKLDELRRNPSRNAAAIRTMEEQMAALVVRLAEERAEATEKAHGQYPFLPRRVLGVRLGDIPLQEDELFAAAITEGVTGKEPFLQSRALELVVCQNLNAAQLADSDDAVLSQHPYLVYTSRKCFPLRHLPLDADVMFVERLREYNDLLQAPSMNEDAAAIARFRLALRADSLALHEIEKIERIKQKFGALQPLSLEDLRHLQDHREFQRYTGDGAQDPSPVLLEDAKRIIIDNRKDRAARVQELDAVRKTYPALGRDIDPELLKDPAMAKLVNDRDALLDNAEGDEGRLKELEEEIARHIVEHKGQLRGESIGLESEVVPRKQQIVDSYVVDMEDDITDDVYYQELVEEYANVETRQLPEDAPLLRRLATQMEMRKDQVKEDNKKLAKYNKKAEDRALTRYPFLKSHVHAIPITDLHLEDDAVMGQLEQQRDSQRPIDVDSPTVINNKMTARAEAMAKAVLEEEEALAAALPFLGRSVKGVPLRELALMSDPEFSELASRYAQEASSGDAAGTLRLEQELHDQACRVAREVRLARRLDAVRDEDLHERYPFLPEEPVRGISLGDVRPVQQPAFRELSNKLDELRRNPSRNAAAIRTMEEQMAALVVRLAEERAEATEKAHGQYPFLPRRVLGVRLGDIPLQEDDVLSQLARRRMRQRRYTSKAKDVHDTEEEMVKRAEELARAARLVDAHRANGNEYVRARNPFLLYEDRKCVPLSEIPLAGDDEYQGLFRDHMAALEDAEANAARIAELEGALRSRADELALEVCERDAQLAKYAFLSTHNVPGWSEALLHDAEFQKLRDRYDELSKDPQGNAEALRELEDAMEARSRAIAEALGAAEGADAARALGASEDADAARALGASEGADAARALGASEGADAAGKTGPRASSRTDSAASAGGGEVRDGDFVDAVQEARLTAEGAVKAVDSAAKSSRRHSRTSDLHRSVVDLGGEAHGARYAFLPDVINGVAQGDLYLEDDAYFQELLARYNELVPVGTEPTVPQAKQLLAQLRIRAGQLAADVRKLRAAEERAASRMAAVCPFLSSAPLGVALWRIPVDADDEFSALLRDREEALAKKTGSVHETEAALGARAEAMAKAVLEEEEALAAALPFLGRSVKGVPLRELALMSDPEFSELASRYAQEASSGDAAGTLRLEQELHDQACRVAREVRLARRLDAVRDEDLHERYPFLPEEPVRGISLGDVRPVQQPAFRELSNKLDELRRNPSRNAAAIRTMEEQMAALVVRLAEERAEATEKAHGQYPFLPRRVLGVRLGDIPLQEDDVLSHLARRRMRQRRYTSKAKDVHDTEEEMVKRAEELARAARLVDAHRANGNEYVRARNPFLLYEDRKCVPLSEIPLAGDDEYQGLFRDHMAALEDAEANAARIAELEGALRSRADELALEVCERDAQLAKYAFLSTHNVPGWSEALLHDAEFQKLRDRYDELSKDPQGNAEALRELEDAMEARSRAIAEALGAAEGADAARALGASEDADAARALGASEDADAARALGASEGADAARALGASEGADAAGKTGPRASSRTDSAASAGGGEVRDGDFVDAVQEARLTAEGAVKAVDSAAKSSRRHSRTSDLHRSVVDLGGEAHGARYAFLPDVINGVAQGDLYLEDDAYFQELLARYNELVPVGTEPTVPQAKQLLAQLRIRAGQLAADVRKLRAAEERAASRMAAVCPFLSSAPLGVALWRIPVDADDEFSALLRDREEALAKKTGSVHETEAALGARAEAMAKAVLEEEEALAAALPFLGRSVKGVPLRELALMSDPEFSELASRYAQEASSGDAAGTLRLEQELHDQACRVAREVRLARRLDAVRDEDLHERYPFLPEEPVRGISLGDVRPVQQPAFRELSNKLDELRRNPSRNAAAIRTMEEQMAALVVRLAEERAEATEKAHGQYPFLPRRVLGVRLGDISLQEDDVLSQLARRRMRQRRYTSNPKDIYHTEKEMVKRAEELARAARLVDAHRANGNEYVRARNPFLLYEDRKCVPLSEIPLAGDGEYQGLFRDHMAALEDAEANAARIAELEGALRSRADELALEVCERDAQLAKYAFLSTHNVPGWSEALLHDAEFQKLRDRYDELSKDPQGNAEALRELEDAMEARSRAIADLLRMSEANNAAEQARLRALFPMCADLPFSAEGDNEVVKLLQRRSSLLGSVDNSRTINLIDRSLRRRVSLLTLSMEETAIECCEESEVVTFDVRMKRSVGKHRRLRHTGGANQRDGSEGRGAVGHAEEGASEERASGRHVGADGVTSELPPGAEGNRGADVMGGEEGSAGRTIPPEEALSRVEQCLGAVDACETASREELMRDEQSALYAELLSNLRELEEIARSAVEKEHDGALVGLMEEKAAEEASIRRGDELAAVVSRLIAEESSDRARLQHGEEGKRAALLAEGLQLEEGHLRQLVELNEVQAAGDLIHEEAAGRARAAADASEREVRRAREQLCDEESADRGRLHGLESGEMGALHKRAVTEKNSIILTTAMKELCDAEAQGRLAITAGEEEGQAQLGIMKLIGSEMLPRQEIEEEGERLLASTRKAFDELLEFTDTMHAMVLAVEDTEGEERAKLMDEEDTAREQMTCEVEKVKDVMRDRMRHRLNEVLQALSKAEREERAKLIDEENIARGEFLLDSEGGEIGLRRQRKVEDELRSTVDGEGACRDGIAAHEQEDMNSLRRRFEASLALQAPAAARLRSEEEEARRTVADTEARDLGHLQEEFAEASVEVVRAEEEREAQQIQRRKDAQALIKSVVFAYRIRRRLANRLLNRKAQEKKNAVADMLRTELNARTSIGDEERLGWQQIEEARQSLLSLRPRPAVKTTAELEKEEDDARHQMMDDFAFHLSQLQRASRKALAKQRDLIPSLKQLQEFEETEDQIHGTEVFSATDRRLGLPLSDTGDEGDEEDDAMTPLTSGKYKGYALDSIGMFLLQYERDLQRFKASLEKNRMAVAADHDLLKKARDNATQDVVHGGTGALWIPTRPLPLSDLVRGPSAQYRRGRIVDARGQRPTSRMTDADGRAATPSDAPFFNGLVK